uniref:Glycosyl-hydrolase family 116 N-terminal domain-containing protein n=1 Tax=Ignisphaera aggregans TaxID=334771 RepID=A0A7J2U1Y1_9CREN
MSSGIPLGDIGCGTVEIRGDGRFYEWHIFNNGRWALRKEDRNREYMKVTDLYFVARVRDGDRVVVRFLQAAKGYRQLEEDDMPWKSPTQEICCYQMIQGLYTQ